MYDEINLIIHSCIRIETKRLVVYFDPYHMAEEPHDADVIFVTHGHYDHFSPEDIAKVKKEGTLLLCPKVMEKEACESGIEADFIESVEAGDELEIDELSVTVVPAYNVGKKFHTKESGGVGYVVTAGGTRYYVAGDTDMNEDIKQVKCDVALLPIGGKYTMDKAEAAELAQILMPDVVIPTHYGDIVGNAEDGQEFAELLDGKVRCLILM